MIDASPVIRVKNVTQRFRLIHERPDTLRELFSKRFRSRSHIEFFEAVKNVSFDVYRGDSVALVGVNGSGKSTLLKAIAGVYQPSEGRVEVTGSIAPMIELGAGFHPELTGRENIVLNGLLMGYSKATMLERQNKILDFAGIGEFVDVPVKQYSSGMYARLAFAVASEVDPDILVIDEILAVGDAAFQAKCMERLQNFRKSGRTILFVSHSPPSVLQLCNRAVLLEAGRMVMEGKPEDVIERYLPGTVAAAVQAASASEDLLSAIRT
jgi:ABC-type polysaccharide/polyol phosphate transport system ATPase subunit